MAREYPVPTTAELDALFEALKNWGRWGDDDERGTLAFLTDERRAAARVEAAMPGAVSRNASRTGAASSVAPCVAMRCAKKMLGATKSPVTNVYPKSARTLTPGVRRIDDARKNAPIQSSIVRM